MSDYESKLDFVNPYLNQPIKLSKLTAVNTEPISKLTLNNLIIKNKSDKRTNIF